MSEKGNLKSAQGEDGRQSRLGFTRGYKMCLCYLASTHIHSLGAAKASIDNRAT
ncbi:hypothetical protein A2U01_0034784, partial [Trifolium medium]|nr:hypothetical protein [Trifolium medium]